jgi:glycosyltransferase involved in cell wall biosynthesis
MSVTHPKLSHYRMKDEKKNHFAYHWGSSIFSCQKKIIDNVKIFEDILTNLLQNISHNMFIFEESFERLCFFIKQGFSILASFSVSKHNDYYVGIDCLSLPPHFSGTAYYIFYLTKALLQNLRPFQLVIFCKTQHISLFQPLIKAGDKIVAVPLPNRAARLCFYETSLAGMLIKEHIQIFLATHYICPPRKKDYFLVNTFYDMGFFLHPQYYPLVKTLYFRSRIASFLQRPDVVVAISGATQSAIIELFPKFAGKVKLIYPGTDHLLNHREFPGTRYPFPFVAAVNIFEKRKNIPFVIRVFNHLKEHFYFDHKLLLIGHAANGMSAILKEIRQSQFKADILIESSIPSSKLAYVYQNCEFFLNASEYEGFGFAPFEAIRYQRPSFIFKNQVIHEFFGNQPYLFENLNAESWANFIREERSLNFSNRISSRDIQHLSWNNTAQETIGLFQKLHEGRFL